MKKDVLAELANVLEARKTASPRDSYVAGLYGKGLNKILEKVGEESTETILAAKEWDGSNSRSTEKVIKETADLWFHTLVMLSHLGLSHTQVLEELEKRFNISGLDEKASRQTVSGGQA